MSIWAPDQAIGGLVSKIVILLAIGALQVGGAKTSDTLYGTGITEQCRQNLIEVVKRTNTLMGGVVGLISVVAGVDTGIIVEERFIPPRIVALGADVEISALNAGRITS